MYKYKVYFSLYCAGEIISRGITKIIPAASESEARLKIENRYPNFDVFICLIELLWPNE
jgi:hypothetical protein